MIRQSVGRILAPAIAVLVLVAITGTGVGFNFSGVYGLNNSQVQPEVLVNAAGPTAVTINCVPNPVVVNQASTCTATVTDTSVSPTAPTGEVTFTSDGTGAFSGSPCTLANPTSDSASCSISYTPTAVGTGTHIITGSYGGDATHSTSSGSQALTVYKRTTSTSLSCVPSSIAVGQTATCTATVTDTSPGTPVAPAGPVTFASSGTGTFNGSPCTLGSQTSNSASCSVTYTPTTGGTGTHTITATYNGDAIHLPSSGSFSFVICLGCGRTTTLVDCSPSTVAVNQATGCAVTVTDTSSSGASAPTGTVSFTSSGTGATVGSPCTLGNPTSNSASCSVTYIPTAVGTGTHTITGTYSGDAIHPVSLGSFAETVTTRNTATSLSCFPSQVRINIPTSCIATVSDVSIGTTIAPTGTVSFTSSGIGTFTGSPCNLGTPTSSSASCSATYTPTAGSFGTSFVITASYGGDSIHGPSSGSTALTVCQCLTSTSVNCSPSTVAVGQATNCTAAVTDTSSPSLASAPTGTVSFVSSGAGFFNPPSCTLISISSFSSQCSVSYTPTGSGTQTITASYAGDSIHPGSVGTTSVTVTNQPPVCILSISPSSALTGQTITASFSCTDPDDGIRSITIDWGDGSNNFLDAFATSATHTYTNTGNAMSKMFTITVTATDNGGAQGSVAATITIFDRPPMAAFTFTPNTPSVGQTVIFNGTSSADPDGSILSFMWDFGDTTTGSGAVATHVYVTNGTFTVTLTVTDNSGKNDIVPSPVRVLSGGPCCGHVSLAHWRASVDIHHESLAKDPTNTFRAYVVNDGNATVWAYVKFHVIIETGASQDLFTQVVQLTPGMVINGKNDPEFSLTFTPPQTGSLTVTATAFYSSAFSQPPLGSSLFTGDLASQKTFSLTVVP